jgi:hypothetical protein
VAIRLRRVNGEVALCAAETDPEPNDIYLDDGWHYALAAKFARDWQGRTVNWKYEDIWADMDTQKRRDAVEELNKWLALSGHSGT